MEKLGEEEEGMKEEEIINEGKKKEDGVEDGREEEEMIELQKRIQKSRKISYCDLSHILIRLFYILIFWFIFIYSCYRTISQIYR